MSGKISEKEIIKKIGELSKIEPSKKWSDFVYQNIINQVANPDSTDFALTNKILEKMKFLSRHFIFRPTVAAVFIFILIISSITVTWADNQALPGEPLYPIKLAIEEIQGDLITSPSKRAIYQTQLVQERISEIKKIISSETSKQKKKEMVNAGIVQLKKQLVVVNNQLANTPAASSVVQNIDNAKQELIKVKKEASKEIGASDVTQKIDQTVKAVDEVATKALVVSVDQNHQIDSQKVSDKIKEAEDELKLAKERMAMTSKQLSDKNNNTRMSQKDLASTTMSTIMSSSSTSSSSTTTALDVASSSSTLLNSSSSNQTIKLKKKSGGQSSMIKIAQSQIKQAEEILGQAKDQVNDNPSSALNKVLTVRKILATVNQITGAVLPMDESNNDQQSSANKDSDKSSDKISSDKNKNVTSTNNTDINASSSVDKNIRDNVITTTSTKDIDFRKDNSASSTIATSTVDEIDDDKTKIDDKMIKTIDTEASTSSSTSKGE